MTRNAFQLVVTFVFATLLAGCSGLTGNQVVRIQSFGGATANVGKIGEDEFVNIRNGIIEMNRARLALDKNLRASEVDTDKAVSLESTTARVAAAKALKLYGELLVKLATDDRSTGLQSAANDLVNNTSTALGKDLSDDQKNALNKLIAGIGNYWVERKKAEAAQAIIPAYQKPVNELADLLINDFARGEGADGYISAYRGAARRLTNAASRVLKPDNNASVLERERAVQALVMAEQAITRADALSSSATSAFQALKKANDELVKAIQNKKYSTDDIKNYAKQIQDLVNVYQVLGHSR